MKMNFAGKASLLGVLLLVVAFLSGCASAPPVDWNSRIGHYTYAQAVGELGPPNRQSRLSNGATELKWFRPPGGPAALPNNGMNNGFGGGPSVNVGLNDQYLQLTFDTNGVLTAWSKNY
ncbi:MAG TPA: hypothetical protein VMA35_12555 [Candidatus Sulfopaludibacter sp.]|nr:hypothetical protein [Candidatus Sulfopaludibacter sp.]